MQRYIRATAVQDSSTEKNGIIPFFLYAHAIKGTCETLSSGTQAKQLPSTVENNCTIPGSPFFLHAHAIQGMLFLCVLLFSHRF